jgi:hypothetical protein
MPSKKELEKPIPAGGMVRSGGKLVPRYARDMGPDEPIRNMRDNGGGLEVVPDAPRTFDRSAYNRDSSPTNKKGDRYK